MNSIKKIATVALGFAAYSLTDITRAEDEVQDMSDPLAVYTQAGFGITDKGLNIKIGQTYDTGSDTTMGMNIIELKGVFGESLGFRGSDEPLYGHVDDSIDSFRFRNFKVDMTNGRGSQIDANINIDGETGDVSYSLIQALPKWGPMQLYPLAGLGVSAANDSDDGFEIPGAFGVLGFYGKFTVTDNIWINYNPVWLSTLAGSNDYEDGHYAGDSNILAHEFAISYQFTPRFNMRYFANWNEVVDYGDGDHRLEFNYQL
ncbi:MAG: hypothetical protein AseanaTS_04630 [Candidatus Pelagadaptatus aseana]|uniref:hypothetical protein n=1 Tax=Candidatus Pelagadaptatus aseana TaxID=3120508 RepID=UPI0039B33F48